MGKKQTAGRDNLEEFTELNDQDLFGEVQSREGEFSAYQRSLITIFAWITSGSFG